MNSPRKPLATTKPRTIVLVGMMGAGKTTIGRRLAPRLNLPFFDADEEIEKAAGMSISELFQSHSEESFRRGEAGVIKRLLGGPPHVLATGGGALTHPDTRALIANTTISIWLKADLDVLLSRATKRSTRPLLKNDNPIKILERLSKEREAFYAQADIHIDSQSGPHMHTVDLIIEKLSALSDIKIPDPNDAT
ncbi:MAG: shikimate kinase [Hyphococcus sp.]|nr:MAG: shikimate kinase [Marinicaulis sp.]